MSWYILTGIVLVAFSLVLLIAVKYEEYRRNPFRDRRPLRERKEDIPYLANWLLKNRVPGGAQLQISPEALEILANYDWPGNAREMEKVLERASVLCQGKVIQSRDLSLPVGEKRSDGEPTSERVIPLKELERQHIERALEQAGFVKSKAANLLGINIRTLNRKIKMYHLRVVH